MNELDYDEARTWSKERIRAEIDLRRDEIYESERWQQERAAEHERQNYANAEPFWWKGPDEYVRRLDREMSFLVSLL